MGIGSTAWLCVPPRQWRGRSRAPAGQSQTTFCGSTQCRRGIDHGSVSSRSARARASRRRPAGSEWNGPRAFSAYAHGRRFAAPSPPA
eukprot:scaffold26988_cov197-Isochrysis_galbana.AAC.5